MGSGMSKILPGLYVGNFRDAKDVEKLAANNITHILSIHDNAKKILVGKEYLCIDASDSPTQYLIQYFPQSIDFIHQARQSGGGVLVHCLAGVSRSVTITAAYIMTVTNLGWRDAVNAIRGARNVANPNFGFQKQLQAYENDGLDEARLALKEKYPVNNFNDEADCQQLLHSYHHFVATGETTTSASFVPKRVDDGLYPLPHNAYQQKVRFGVVDPDEFLETRSQKHPVYTAANAAEPSQSEEDEVDDKELASSVNHLMLGSESETSTSDPAGSQLKKDSNEELAQKIKPAKDCDTEPDSGRPKCSEL